MTFNELLKGKGYVLEQVLVMRHRPQEDKLNKVLPLLAVNRPDLFNAYQQTQNTKIEKAVQQAGFVASFIRFGGRKALYIGMYRKTGEKKLTREQFWQVPAYIEMRDKYGMEGISDESKRDSVQWFDLEPVNDFYPDWKGKLVIDWPEPMVGWCRRASKPGNTFPVRAILDESALEAGMPRWDVLVLAWDQLELLPEKWKAKLAEWRGIYYIFDTSVGKGYVGSASGDENLRQRWEGYADSGHGGNVLLRDRDPKNFLFTILQRMSPDATPEEVDRLETSWKVRLHSRTPSGLNDN
jgi:hypothetical protein